MNFLAHFRTLFLKALKDHHQDFRLQEETDFSKITLEPPKDSSHGDMSTNAALILSKQVGSSPHDFAQRLIPLFQESLPASSDIFIAGPGFINVKLPLSFWHAHLKHITKEKERYKPTQLGQGKSVHIEFVSANPTGPLHAGHTRNAVIGDALASTLEAVGYNVHREYYINDAGAQVDTLARSLYLRYVQACGQKVSEEAFEGLYPGEYVITLAQNLREAKGDLYLGKEESFWIKDLRRFAVDAVMESIKKDLHDLGIEMDTYTSEEALTTSGKVDKALRFLEEKGDIYVGTLEPPKGMVVEDFEAREQTLFRATNYGDTVDRPLKKSDGSWSYFAPDIAYHRDKFERGFSDMIDVLSADHKGYFTRIKAAVQAVTEGQAGIQIRDYEMVNFMENGVPIKMSKRAGNFITLRELLERVGRDVIRFMMLTRHHSMVLDFDFVKVLELTKENPVFYVHYAHARICSVMRHAKEILADYTLEKEIDNADVTTLMDEAEINVIKALAEYPRHIELAASHREPHRIAYYLYDLASRFHSLWNKGKENAKLRFIDERDIKSTFARLALLSATALIIKQGLKIFKIDALEEMR